MTRGCPSVAVTRCRVGSTMRLLRLFLFLILSAPAMAAEAPPAYKIVSEDGAGDTRAIAVRLDDRAPEAGLKALAFALRDKAKPGKTPAVIRFYLPGMALSAAPWAQMRFQDQAQLEINGLRYEEVQAFAAETAADTRDILGVWLTAAPALPGRLTIWRNAKGQRFAEWHLRTGKKTVDELIEVKTQRGRRYEIKGSEGGYYLATWAGPLELGEGKVVIASAERLILPKEQPPVAATPPPAAAAATAHAPAAAPQLAPQALAPVTADAGQSALTTPAVKAPPRRKRSVQKPAPAAKKKGESVAEAIRETMSR